MANSKEDQFEIRPHHCGISVPDIESSITWYHDMLGFDVAKRDVMGTSGKVCFMKRGDFYIELFEIQGAASLPEGRRRASVAGQMSPSSATMPAPSSSSWGSAYPN